ncbi:MULTISPECIES: tetratricopeptide repeat protein [unclassified Janthinobacterium]|uniref:tetratricopeptide repeat protein n=1 Tax=unclassified Janthinobacterium TaxID=2610881 RepID=UPI001615BC72|nr:MULTISPECIES: tetratricopeptide repeat protein [unclassified Janthinobacterium]MBB5607809.1 tetratricopeptide (TPR) repeat protein [Janthinobacterium sp. S3T4]MBB5613042.1 tetratricopeptide (TPR) repeat protein [Janthinobacterium sp. S3M3]
MNVVSHHHYNPDWLGEDALLASFVARQDEFIFLRDELAKAPLEGSVQHYLLVGVRGAGKTTLLKRLAIAVRRDSALNDHLIVLSFPEELYQVKNLADFWWTACEVLADELDFLKLSTEADGLMDALEQARAEDDRSNTTSDAGFKLLQQTCVLLGRRPVMLVDNLDMIFQRIDKNGRKLNDPHAPAYWALREALSTRTSPIVIGGSVRLSAPFKDYDKAFYDFFLPKRLGKLTLTEARLVLERWTDAQNIPDLKQRLRAHPGRIEALFELTGGNPRALGLIFELLRNGPNSRAVEDFERLMDITTPYYKARIEDLSEQAQAIMHALAVQGVGTGEGLRFGHTAAQIGAHAGLPTSTISAQLTILENEGLVEKSADHGRTQYRIAEQLFRLWLQMRGTRRIRQNVIGLTRFFEAMYDAEELQEKLKDDCGASALAEAKFAFAVAVTKSVTASQRQEFEAYGADRLRSHLKSHGGEIGDYLSHIATHAVLPGSVVCEPSVHYSVELIATTVAVRGATNAAETERTLRHEIKINPTSTRAWIDLGMLLAGDIDRQDEAEVAYREAIKLEPASFRAWIMLGMLLDKSDRASEAEQAYRKAIELDSTAANPWLLLGILLGVTLDRYEESEIAYRKAIDLDKADARSWLLLGILLVSELGRYDEAEFVLRRAIELEPSLSLPWLMLGIFLADKRQRYDEAELAYRTAIKLDPTDAKAWNNLGELLEILHRETEASAAYEQAILLGADLPPYWQAIHTRLRVRLCVAAAKVAIEAGNHSALRDALTRLQADPANIAAALVHEQFIEGFLAPMLADAQAASALLAEMRSLGYEKHARPLLLAFDAAINNGENMLSELEPEIQAATKRMYQRLLTSVSP